MIFVNISGGLANMLFMTATAEWLAKKHQKNLCYPNAKEHFDFLLEHGKWVAHAMEYHSIFRFVDWFKNYQFRDDVEDVVSIPFRYHEFTPKDGTEYRGYFQSAKNFDADFARFLFTPTNRVEQRVDELSKKHLKGTTCSIHVRRGNYVKLQDKHVVLPLSYYHRAVQWMDENHKVDKYIVFSDDIEWCKENFQGDEFTFVKDTDYIEMFLMSRCDHNIIANSSFSWWGAFLGKEEGRGVIAPKTWFPNDNPYPHDIVPDNWIKL